MSLSLLFTPLDFLRIEHPKIRLYTFGFPLLLAVPLITIIIFFDTIYDINIYGQDGMASKLANIVNILPGFYIAALAAIATFDKGGSMDNNMPNPVPTLRKEIAKFPKIEELTRRRFLSLLLAYLTLIALLLSVFFALTLPLANSLFGKINYPWHRILSWGVFAIFMTFFTQMFCITMLSLHYLGDRIHRD